MPGFSVAWRSSNPVVYGPGETHLDGGVSTAGIAIAWALLLARGAFVTSEASTAPEGAP